MRKLGRIISRVVLTLAGFFVLFNLYLVAITFVTKVKDVMGVKAIWERPFYYLIVEIAPPLFSSYLWPMVFTVHFWTTLILELILPIVAIVFFERSRLKGMLEWFVLFYLLVPPGLFLVVAEVIRNFFPYL
jgi:hypothetical protein